MDIDIQNTILHIGESEWNTLTDNYINVSHSWYRTVEESNMRDMLYIVIREQKKLEAAAACHLCQEKILNQKLPLLKVIPFFSRSEYIPVLSKEIQEIAKEKAKGIFFSVDDKEKLTLLKKNIKGVVELPLGDNMYIDLPFNSFDDYLKSLQRKQRRSIRVTLKRVERLGVKTLVTHEISAWKAVAHQLQGYFCEQHHDYSSHLPQHFYEALEKNMGQNTEMMLFFKEDIPLAFCLPLYSPTTTYVKIGGADPHYREYQGYFLIYYESIRRAIDKGKKRIYFGPSTYEFKEKIGCRREQLLGLAKLENPLLNRALQLYVGVHRILEKTV